MGDIDRFIKKFNQIKMASEKFCLKWNDFQSCTSQSFHIFRKEKDFFDVTLVSEDQVQFESHKVILSASSNFFKNILRKNTHTHPLLYLHGIQSTSLQLILDYVYQGEVQIYQEQLDQFMTVASDLQIMGLQESSNVDDGKNYQAYNDSKYDQNPIVNRKEQKGFQNDQSEYENRVSSSKIVAIVDNEAGDDTSITELMEKISQLTDKVDGIYICKVCQKQAKDRTNLGKHIESHIDGITLTCEYCNKKFRSRTAIRLHKMKNH